MELKCMEFSKMKPLAFSVFLQKIIVFSLPDVLVGFETLMHVYQLMSLRVESSVGCWKLVVGIAV